MAMTFFQRIKLLREFNSNRRRHRREHPEWSDEECYAAALDDMRETYGDTPDWNSILKMLLEFLMSILPFFFLSEE